MAGGGRGTWLLDLGSVRATGGRTVLVSEPRHAAPCTTRIQCVDPRQAIACHVPAPRHNGRARPVPDLHLVCVIRQRRRLRLRQRQP